jgi:endonuclease/exonuclease/phosphatase family metal-dependent hydrolase
MRVMSFNLGGAYNPADPGPQGWAARQELAADVVRDHAPDIVVFQEFDALHIAWFEAALPDYACLPGPPGDTVERPTFNALGWRRRRWRLHGSGGWHLNEEQRPWVRGWDAAYIRTATWAHLEERASGRGVLVVNTHLDHLGATSRLESMDLMLRLIDEQNVQDLPVVLAGDFNSNGRLTPVGESHDSAFSDGVMSRALTAGYVDAFTVSGAADDEVGFTYHAYEGFDYQSAQHSGSGRLDWILTRGLAPAAYQRITRAAPPVYPSDHWPIVAAFEFTR